MSYGGASQGTYAGRWQGRQSIPALDTRLFDHGLGLPLRTLVQFGVVRLLDRLHVDNGGYVAAIEPTSTVIKGGHDEEGIQLIYDQLQGRAPAIAVATAIADYKPGGAQHNWQKTIAVHLYAFVNNLRGRLERLTGDAVSAADTGADPGAYVLVEHCEELLIGQMPGGALGHVRELRPASEDQLGGSNDVELWHQSYTVIVSRSIDANRDLDLELQTINTYSRLATQAPTDDALVETTTVIT